jgi:hypothetical protein
MLLVVTFLLTIKTLDDVRRFYMQGRVRVERALHKTSHEKFKAKRLNVSPDFVLPAEYCTVENCLDDFASQEGGEERGFLRRVESQERCGGKTRYRNT